MKFIPFDRQRKAEGNNKNRFVDGFSREVGEKFTI